MEERKAGSIRHLGWSFHGSKETFDAMLELHDQYHWDFVQIQMNYVDWRIPKGSSIDAEYLYNELAKREIPVVIMEPLLGGRLSKVPDHVVSRLKQKSPESSVASWAFRFAGTPKYILTVLSGMAYMEHLQDNIRTYSPLIPLTEEENEYLYETASIMEKYPTVPCTECKYCMPCPYGIDIPSIFLHYNKCVNEGNVPEDVQDENYKEARRAFLVGYDRSVPKLRQANHCIGCRKCVSHCPQRINIPRQLHRIDKFVEMLKQDTLGVEDKG
jgi:predicted aldo/keto reductase-like oxidoreductase